MIHSLSLQMYSTEPKKIISEAKEKEHQLIQVLVNFSIKLSLISPTMQIWNYVQIMAVISREKWNFAKKHNLKVD